MLTFVIDVLVPGADPGFLKRGPESGVNIEGGANPNIVSLKQVFWGPPRSYRIFNFVYNSIWPIFTPSKLRSHLKVVNSANSSKELDALADKRIFCQKRSILFKTLTKVLPYLKVL